MTNVNEFADAAVREAEETLQTSELGTGASGQSTAVARKAQEESVRLLWEVVADAGSLVRRSGQIARVGSQRLRQNALRTADTVTTYIRDEPVKAVLIAAGIGAALSSLVSWRRGVRRIA